MPKLHELLAVETTLKGQGDKTVGELTKTFKDKRHHFEKTIKVFRPNEEGAQEKVEEEKDLQSSVPYELRWITGILTPVIDVGFQIDEANTRARADLEIDGHVLAEKVPSTALLRLEHRFDELHKFVTAIPTLDPAKGFEADSAMRAKNGGKGVYRSRPETATRTKKTVEVIVKYPATPEHPAQTELVSLDKAIGEVVTTHWSGMLTVDQKGDLLDRVEKVRVGIKAAIARANAEEADKNLKVADRLFGYVFGEVLK